ncbi:MAG: hypothetical protein F9K29_03585 [Hyphomicrobiaceae bacterium]|nr:MAG: hypothetical protein F9K29_03585 [Hyphomicrobiaceae bacterium]
MRYLCIVIALVAFVVRADAPKAATLESSMVEGWLVGAYTNDQTGKFNHCATSVRYQSGIYLIFSIGRNFAWSMGFASPRWKLTRGAEYNLYYYIDTGPGMSVRGRAVSSQLVEVVLTDSHTLFESFRRGYQLTVQAADDKFTFNLTNSSKALAATLECARRHVAPTQEAATNPFGPRQQPTPPDAKPSIAQSDARAEAAVVVANVLSAAGLPGFRVLTYDETPADLRLHHAVWVSQNLAGSLRIFPRDAAKNVEELASYVMARDAQDCKGVFASGRYPTSPETGAARLMTGCSSTNAPVDISYTIAPRAKGGFYLFATMGTGGNAEPVKDAGVKLHEAALKSVTGR